MITRDELREDAVLLTYFKKPLSNLRSRLETFTFDELSVNMEYVPGQHVGGVSVLYDHALNLLNNIYVNLITVFQTWEKNSEVLSDDEISRFMLCSNFDIYECLLCFLRLGEIYLPALSASAGIADNYKTSIYYYLSGVSLLHGDDLARGIPKEYDKYSQEEKKQIFEHSAIPYLKALSCENFEVGTGIDMTVINEFVNIRDQFKLEHPSIGKIFELANFIKFMDRNMDTDTFMECDRSGKQRVILTALSALSSWDIYTFTAILKYDQYQMTTFKENESSQSYNNYRELNLTVDFNPLVLTTTSIN